jgi:glutamine synthetase
VHLSLWSPDGESNLFAEGPAGELTTTASGAIAGLLATMAAATPITCPTVNSHQRQVPYSWSGTTATWGLDNRTAGLRAIEAEHGLSRIEHRQPGADANPHLALTAMLAGMLHGIEHDLVAPPPFAGDAFATPGLPLLPVTLDAAIDALESDTVLRGYLGDDLVDHMLVHRAAEAEHHRAAVTAWERQRYLELS